MLSRLACQSSTLVLTFVLAFTDLTAPAATALAAPSPEQVVARVVHLTNVERSRAGLSPLVANAQLGAAAQSYAEVLANDDCFSHTCGPVPIHRDRVEQAGYLQWTRIGENIAGGQTSPEQAVSEWMQSPTHRANILNGQFTEIGVGHAMGHGSFGIYWTQAFGRRLTDGALAFRPVMAPEPVPEVAPSEEAAIGPTDMEEPVEESPGTEGDS